MTPATGRRRQHMLCGITVACKRQAAKAYPLSLPARSSEGLWTALALRSPSGTSARVNRTRTSLTHSHTQIIASGRTRCQGNRDAALAVTPGLTPEAASARLSHGSASHRWMLGNPAVCARRHLCRDPLQSHGRRPVALQRVPARHGRLPRAGSHGSARPCARAGPTAHQARIDRRIPAHKSEIRSGAQLWQGSTGPASGRGTSRLTAGCQSCRTPFTRAEQSARQGSRTRPPGAPSAESPARRHPGAGRRSPRHLPSAVR